MNARRVLYVEDNPVNVRLVARVLQLRPHVVLTDVGTGEAGLTTAGETLPDLILLDWRLPRMQGAEVLQQLKSAASTAHIPVVVFSGDSGRDQVQEILRSGAAQFLPKPFDIAELLAVVDTFCGAHQKG